MDAQKFGTFLLGRRKELGLTQAQLAERIHVTDKAVSRWERGVGLPDINLLEPLAEALEISVLELIRTERVAENQLPIADANNLVEETIALAAEQTESILKQQQRKPISFYISTLLTCIGTVLLCWAAGTESPNTVVCLVGICLALVSPIHLFVLATNYYIFWKSSKMSNYRNARYQ